LLSLPQNATKLFPKLSPRAAAQRARAKPDIARISAANAKAYLGSFSTLMNWCVSEELIGRNPARGLRLPDEIAKRDKRHLFSPDQLKLIFGAPLYTGCRDGERG
jgi:integrase